MATKIPTRVILANSVRCMIASVMLLCLTGQTCDLSSIGNFRNPPAIVPASASADSFSMSFTVDIHQYPETTRVSWEFGDGGSTSSLPLATGRTINHTFTKAGVFNVQVHLFDSGDAMSGRGPGKIADGSLPVSVLGPNKLPIANVQITDLHDADGNVLGTSKHFSASSSSDTDGGISDYAWDFGDGTTGSGVSLDHDFGVGGQFTVRLTVTDNRGGTASTARTLLVNAPPRGDFTFTFSGGNLQTADFDASGSSDSDGTVVSYAWDFGDGQQGTGKTVSHAYANPDTYDAKLTVTDSSGLTGSITKSVHVAGQTLFLRSISVDVGVTGTVVSNIHLGGENFKPGLASRLVLDTNTHIQAASITFVSSTELIVSYDLTGATVGDYDVFVADTGNGRSKLTAGFHVASTNHVKLFTSSGNIVFELVSDAPITTANFLQYVEDHFYDGTIFHRVVPDFIVQGGGFLPGDVEQSGIRPAIQNEFSPSRSNVRASVAMAKIANNPNSATSQFFINLADNSSNLDNQNGGFTVFAHVTEGMDVADAMAAAPRDSNDKPTTDIVLTKARRD